MNILVVLQVLFFISFSCLSLKFKSGLRSTLY